MVRAALEDCRLADLLVDVLSAARGAIIAIAGHDHVAAMVGAGADAEGDVLHSLGTLEVFVRAIPARLEAGADLSAATLARSDAVGGPRRRIVATGGGVRGAAARAVKEQRLGTIEWSPVKEATARGAALLGSIAAGTRSAALAAAVTGGRSGA